MTLRLLCDAIPFCYGPAAALETFLDALFASSPARPQVDILATGSTYELLSRSAHPLTLLHVDSEDPDALASVAFDSYDAFFNVCNPVSFRAAVRRGTPTAYLDFLLWMHEGPPAAHFDADLYLAENYPGTADWIDRRGSEIANLCLIPPLVRPAAESRRGPGLLLIGLGGLYSRLTVPGANTNYPLLVLRSVLEAIPSGRFSRVLIAGPEGIRSAVADLIASHPNAEYASLSHEDFLATLATAEVFVSHPGLYAAFEAMLSGVPTAFLPPSNYTQVLQLRHYRALGLADDSFSWEDAGLDVVPPGLEEEAGVRAVLEVLARAEASVTAKAGLEHMLAHFFQLSAAELEGRAARQRAGAALFGVDGPRAAAEHFVSWASGVSRGAAVASE